MGNIFHQKALDVFWKIRRHSLGDVITLPYDRESGLWEKYEKTNFSHTALLWQAIEGNPYQGAGASSPVWSVYKCCRT